MMKKKIACLLMGAAACLLAVSVLASEPGELPTFESLDADHSGTVSGEEAAPCEALLKAFDRIDADQNGKLDRNEYAAFKEAGTQKN